MGAFQEQLRSGYCESGWDGGYWRLEMRLELVLGYGPPLGDSGARCGYTEAVHDNTGTVCDRTRAACACTARV